MVDAELNQPIPSAPAEVCAAVRSSARMRLFVRQVEILLGSVDGLECLDIGGGGWASLLFRQWGGRWTSAEGPGLGLECLRYLCGGERVVQLEGSRLPLSDHAFDVVLIASGLDQWPDPLSLVKECHRVLKPAGRLVVNVPFAARVQPLRWLGLEMVRGFTVSSVFELLKDGFDLQECRRYSRLLIELADAWARWWARRHVLHETASTASSAVAWCHAMATSWRRWSWLAWAATQLDAFLFLSPGYRLVVRARRRLWIPRKVPTENGRARMADAVRVGRAGSAALPETEASA